MMMIFFLYRRYEIWYVMWKLIGVMVGEYKRQLDPTANSITKHQRFGRVVTKLRWTTTSTKPTSR